jgi:DNA replication protein DnaC
MTDFVSIVDGLRAYSESPTGKADAARIREEDRLRRQREAASLFAATGPSGYRGKDALRRCDDRLMRALAWLASPSTMLLMSGQTGTGKSTMAAELMRRHLAVSCRDQSTWERGQSVSWVRADELERDADRFGETANRARVVALLVLDELAMGGERTKAVLWSRFERVGLRTIALADVPIGRLTGKFPAALVRRVTECDGKAAEIVEAW